MKSSTMLYSSDHQNNVLFITIISTLLLLILIKPSNARSSIGGLHSEESTPESRVQQCREGCLEKVKSY